MSCPSCGSVEVTQKHSGKHTGEYCGVCDRWLRWVPGDWKEFIWPVGQKHKGQTLNMIVYNDRRYLEWAAENMTGTLQKRAKQALDATQGSQPAPKEDAVVDHKTWQDTRFNQTAQDVNTDLPW
jgi:hypothetical protein